MQVGDSEVTVRDEGDPHAVDRHPLKKYKMTKQMAGDAPASVLGLQHMLHALLGFRGSKRQNTLECKHGQLQYPFWVGFFFFWQNNRSQEHGEASWLYV